jgi:hypothetical protein
VDSLGSRRFNISGFDIVQGVTLENSPSRKPLTASDTGSLSLEANLKLFSSPWILFNKGSLVVLVLFLLGERRVGKKACISLHDWQYFLEIVISLLRCAVVTYQGNRLQVLASMADENGQVSAAAMERLTASAAAEPYESVRCAFACYGSCGLELAEGWKRRSRLWYGVGLPQEGSLLGGGGSSFEAWASVVERDADGQWIDLPLVRKSIAMLQALLLDEYGPGAGGGGIVGFGGGAGAGSGGAQLQQLLDSDQPFFAMLRIVLLALREEDKGEPTMGATTLNKSSSLVSSSALLGRPRSPSGQWMLGSDIAHDMATRRAKSSLLWW